MRSLLTASHLLTAASSPQAIDALLAYLGFAPAQRLDDAACRQLGIPPAICAASVARGPGILRALHLELPANAQFRELLTHAATQLTARVPHLLWLIVATQRDTHLIAIAAWPANVTTPRISALVAHRNRIVESDAETLCTLAATPTPPNDLLTHAHWIDTLGRQAITGRFYRAIERHIHQLANSASPAIPPKDARTLAILYTSRLLFLAFLQTKGWLNDNFAFLIQGFIDCATAQKSYHRTVLDPLFFGTLNTRPHARAKRAHAFGKIPFLNGGLFTRTPLERKHRYTTFHNDAFAALYEQLFARYRFSPREESAAWTEAAIDPEMLGKVFESLMAPDDRKRTGAFYTPQPIVHRVTHAALVAALQTPDVPQRDVLQALEGSLTNFTQRGLLLERTTHITILDPACGSGAFLVHSLELLASLRASLGDIRPISAIRRSLLTSAIHGVDINPTAVWMCELRLWLSVVIDNSERDPMRILPLPNLDHQIRVGNSLTGGDFSATLDHATTRTHRDLRLRYARATGQRKRTLGRLLDRTIRTHTIANLDREIAHAAQRRKELLYALRTTDLFTTRHALSPAQRRQLKELRATTKRLRATRKTITQGAALPFTFAAHFPAIAQAGGFSIILGNPPWVRLHHVAPPLRRTLRHMFTTFRNAPWHEGAANARAGTGFAAQIDLAALFVERATHLLAPNGALALLLPAKLWRSLAGGGMRHLLATTTHLAELEDFSNAPPSFDAATYPSLVVATRTPPHRKRATPPARFAVHHAKDITRWNAAPHTLPLTHTPDSPWLLVPPKVRTAFNAIAQAATPLTHTPLHHPSLGVKSGCNDAFLVHEIAGDDACATIESNARQSTIERDRLRPLLRGDALKPWIVQPSSARIVWTHDQQMLPLRYLPPHTERWLQPWRQKLIHRTDAKNTTPWWTLFRTHAARNHLPRVVWSDFARAPRATFLQSGDPTVPLNTCYVVHTPTPDDAAALVTLLNSPLIAAWLNLLAEPARGGYHRYLAWTMALIPIPLDWPTARAQLAPIAYLARKGTPPTTDALLHATLQAYALHPNDVLPLLQWNAR